MKNVGRIFSIIGGVLAILSGLALVLSGVLLLLINVPEIKDIFVQGMQFLQDETSLPFTEYLDLMITGSIIAAIFIFVFAAISFVAGGISLSCHKKKNYVTSIIFNVIAEFNTFAILGAIFGAIFDKQE